MSNIETLYALAIVWGLMMAWFIYSGCHQFYERTTYQTVLQKGILSKDSLKSYPKFLLISIFSRPSNGFKMKGTTINIEVITHRSDETKMYKFVSIAIDCTQLTITHECFLTTDYRFHVMAVRKSSLPPISRVRAVHNGFGDAKIFFEGIEVIDQNNGIRRFYEIKETIIKNNIKNVNSFIVKAQSVRLCSKETMAPIFYSLSFETIGDKNRDNETKEILCGVVVQPKLNWFEVWVHFLFLINSTFTTMISLFLQLDQYFRDNRVVLILISIFGSSLTSLLITELIGFIYRRFIKSQFEKKCSPMKISLKRSSTLWQLIRAISLSAIFLSSVLSTVFLTLIFPKNKSIGKILKIGSFDESVLVLCLLILCLIITFSFGFTTFGLIRFLFRLLTIREESDQKDAEINIRPKDFSELSETSTQATTLSEKKVDRKERGETLEEIKEVIESQKKGVTSVKTPKLVKNTEEGEFDSKGYRKGGKKLVFNTDRLEKDFADKEKKKRLTTKSVITSPAKSKGFLNPEDFRLTNSKIERENQKNIKKKKK